MLIAASLHWAVLAALATATSDDAGWPDLALRSCPSDDDVVAAVASRDEGHVDLAIDGEELLAPDEHTHRFVMFYEPWCMHCKRLLPVWSQLAARFNNTRYNNNNNNNSSSSETELVLATVDCTRHTKICDDRSISGFPTLLFFRKGEVKADEFRGPRDSQHLLDFIAQKLYGEDALLGPPMAVPEKGLFSLDARNFAAHVTNAGDDGQNLVLFYAPWCGHCKALMPAWEELAATLESDASVNISRLDCTKAKSVCSANGVTAYPTIKYFRSGGRVEDYTGDRSLPKLMAFVRNMQQLLRDSAHAEDEARNGDNDNIVGDEEAVAVATLNKDNFAARTKHGSWLVLFHAPWCAHCQRMVPAFTAVAESHVASVSEDNDDDDDSSNAAHFAAVDCTSHDGLNMPLCTQEQVNGFPTLQAYFSGQKVSSESGFRAEDDIEAFLLKHLPPRGHKHSAEL